jgi:hypothetical protein
MLDTEHLEVRIRLKSSLPDLVNALRRKADVVAFQSLAGRHNLTVFFQDDDTTHTLPAGQLPAGSQVAGIVKKCRVIERGGDEFAVLPICYPSIPHVLSDWPRAADRRLFGIESSQTPFGYFYAAALLSALTVLEWTLKSIYAAGPDVASVYLPTTSTDGGGYGSYSLEHLRVMYPTLSLDLLQERLAAVDARASQQGIPLRRHSTSLGAFEHPHQATMESDAWQLLQVIRFNLDQKIVEERTYDQSWVIPTPFGLTAQEIFCLGDRLEFKPAYISSLFDLLIDNGHLVTHIARRPHATEPIEVWTRVFEPDGEMVSELVRLYTTQRGLPRGF